MSHEDTELTRQLAELDDWITEACKRGAVPVLTGMNGDMDTVGSAIALAASMNKSLWHSIVARPQIFGRFKRS